MLINRFGYIIIITFNNRRRLQIRKSAISRKKAYRIQLFMHLFNYNIVIYHYSYYLQIIAKISIIIIYVNIIQN